MRDGQEALDFLFCKGEYSSRNKNDKPQVILLDINLPKIGGLEVLRQLRENKVTTLVPVVIMTTSDEQNDLISSYKLDSFMDAIKQLGMYWLVLNQQPS